MLKLKVWLLSLLVVAIMTVPVMAGNNDSSKTSANAATTTSAEGSPTAGDPSPAPTPSPSPSVGLGIAPTASDGNVTALLGVLVMKGVLAPTEANAIREASPTAQFQALVQALSQKGLVSEQDLSVITAVPGPMAIATQPAAPAKPAEPAVIPAVAPLRVLPIDIPKQGGVIPTLKLASGVSLSPYGFYKATAVSETASSGGPTFGSQDWPLPLLLADTGPTSDPQVHIKARSFRIGAQTEWVPKDSGFILTGRVEGDFEGDYTNVNNRNISSASRPQFDLRLAWVRLDKKLNENSSWFAEFGEDWNLLGGSTLPSLFETTGLGVAMGSLYERTPQFKTGVQFRAGDFKVQPEFAIVMQTAGSAALTTDDRLRYGDRAGAESNQPGLEARVVFQFPLNKSWKGVAPAQIIFSGHHGRMNEIIPHTKQAATSFTFTPECTADPVTGVITCSSVTVPTALTNLNTPNVGLSTAAHIFGATNTTACAASVCSLYDLFPTGTQVGNPQNIWTAEVQLPTPWVTFVAKYYRGNDMRYFFAGQLNDAWNDLGRFGLVETPGNGISESGRAIAFGCSGGTPDESVPGQIDCNGTPVQAAYLHPAGGSGGFAELSFPLSRIFHANPNGANSGWILHLGYGTDRSKYSDSQHGNHLGRTDLDSASLTYRLNKWATFVYEGSYITTFTANDQSASGFAVHHLLFEGKDVRQAHNWRNEFGPVFTF